jgi:hypothetical protein
LRNMNRAILPGVGLALAIALGSAIADTSLPPPPFDVGGETEDEVVETAVRLDVWLRRVPFSEALAVCNRIMLARYNLPYPASETADGSTLLGCLIRDSDLGRPVIVYSYDWTIPPAHLLRHELGHLLGWPGTHERN